MSAARLLLLLLALGNAQLCSAHLLNMSKSRIALLPEGRIEVRLALDLLLTAGSRERYHQLSLLDAPMNQPELQPMFSRLASSIQLELGGASVPLRVEAIAFPDEPESVFLDPLSWPRTIIVLRGEVDHEALPPNDSGLRVRYTDTFRFEEPIANTFEIAATGQTQTRWLVTSQQSPVFDARAWFDAEAGPPDLSSTDWPEVFDFLLAGIRHIVPQGVDHLLFVTGLCLGAPTLRALVVTISLFTVSHSLTLCAMALGWVSAPGTAVELLILGSILWVALANVFNRSTKRAHALAVVVFGLLHGLGFASALLDLGLPSESVLLSLLAFNVGVEIGQLTFVAALILMATSIRAWSAPESIAPLIPLQRRVAVVASLMVGASAGVMLLSAL